MKMEAPRNFTQSETAGRGNAFSINRDIFLNMYPKKPCTFFFFFLLYFHE